MILLLGAGKTLIAARLIREKIAEIDPAKEDRKWTVFLTPTVILVHQQVCFHISNICISIKSYSNLRLALLDECPSGLFLADLIESVNFAIRLRIRVVLLLL